MIATCVAAPGILLAGASLEGPRWLRVKTMATSSCRVAKCSLGHGRAHALAAAQQRADRRLIAPDAAAAMLQQYSLSCDIAADYHGYTMARASPFATLHSPFTNQHLPTFNIQQLHTAARMKSSGSQCSLLGLFLLSSVAIFLISVQKGLIQIRIRYPAIKQYVHVYPPDVFPWHLRPLEGDFTSNRRLNAVRLFEGRMDGSESVIVSPDGRAMMLNKFGGVFEAFEQPDGSFELNQTAKAWLGPGRPLGAAFDARGNMIICDALKGILKLHSGSNEVELLTSRVSHSSPLEPDTPIIYANDLDVAGDGTIYFTTSIDIVLHRNAPHDSRFTHVPSLEGRAGFWDTVKGWGLGMCQGLPRGKLYSYNPATRQTHLLATGFYYSNGVAVAADDSFLVVSETDRVRLLKYWLKGPKAGRIEVMIDHLPGTPDGLSRAPDGNFWAALLALPPPATMTFGSPIIRSLLPIIPETWRPEVHEWGAVVKVSPEGEVLEFLEDPQRADPASKPSAYRVSSAHEHAGRLWLGALVANFVSFVDLRSLPPKPQPVPVTWAPPFECVTPPCDRVSSYH